MKNSGHLCSVIRRSFYTGLFIAWSSPLVHSEPSDNSLEQEGPSIEHLEIIGSRLVEDNLLLGRNVVSHEHLEQRRPSDLTEALSFESGIYINRPGGGGSIASLHLRGSDPNYTLVMIDGIAITDTTDSRGGTFDLAGIDPSTIEKIEIIQGSSLPTYGAGALSGVVNIHTRKPKIGEPRFRFNAESDIDEYMRLNGGIGLSLSDTAFLQTDVAFNDSGLLDSGASVKSLQAVSKLQVQLTDHLDTQFFLRLSDTEEQAYPDESGGIRYAVFRELDQRDTEQIQFALAGTWQRHGSTSARSSLSWFRQERSEASPGISPGTFIPPNGADTQLDRIHWRADFSYDVSQDVALLAGLSYDYEDGQSAGYLIAPGVLDTNFAITRRTLGGFVEARLALTRQTAFHATARLDDVSGFDLQDSKKLSFVHTFSDHIRLRLNHATGFRAPSFFALSHSLTGNANLNIEKARTNDIGLEYNSTDKTLTVTASHFHNRFNDQVDFDELSFTHVNRERVTIKGTEFKLHWQPSARFNLKLNASHLDFDIRGLDRPPRNRPEWLAGGSASYSPNNTWTFTLNGQLRGKQYASSFATGPLFLDNYNQLDFVALWKLKGGMDLSLKLLNAFDEVYEEAVGVPSPGRILRLGLGIYF